MKKSILTAILAGVMLLSGCSGVSEESYNSVVAENTKLQSEKSSLESEKSKIEGENSELQSKIAELEQQNSDNEALIEELEKDNVPLEIVDLILKATVHFKSEILEETGSDGAQTYIYTDLSVCSILKLPSYLPPDIIAETLKEQEETLRDVGQIGTSSYAVLIKSYDFKNITCYWSNGKQSGWVWFDNEVRAEFEKL